MKHLSTVIFLLLIFAANTMSQVNAYNPFYVPRNLPDKDSLKSIVQNPKDPIQKLIALRELGHAYYENKRDSALYFFEQSITTAQSIKSKLWEADACNSIGFVSYVQGNYPRALQFLTRAVTLAEDENSEKGEWKPAAVGFVDPSIGRFSILARSYQHLAVLYGFTGKYSEYSDKELYYFNKALGISTRLGDKAMMSIVNMNTARHYSSRAHLDSTIFYAERAIALMNEAGYKRYIGTLLFILGDAYRLNKQTELAKQYYWNGIEAGQRIENTRSVADNALALAGIYLAESNTDSAVLYGRFAADRFKSTLILPGLANSYGLLSAAFKAKNRIDSAFYYQGLSLDTRKELDADDKARRFQQIRFDEQIKAQETLENERQTRNKIITSFLLAGLAILALIGIFLYRNNLARKRSNQLLQEKNRELEIESALEKVRTRSLAMHKSEELQEVTNTVFEQMRALKIEAQTITIFITIEGSKDYHCWLQNNEQNYATGMLFPYVKGNTVSEDHQMGSGDIPSKTYTRQLKNEWFNYMFTHSEMQKLPESRRKFVLDAEYFTASAAEMNYTKIGIYRYTDKAFTEQEHRILKRFAQVFEQAYIRFLDLEKAEGQAREALIEAALERTRTQSMLMQHSDEIRNISEVFHQQLLHLNIPSEFSYVWLPNEERKDHQFWASWEEDEEGETVYKSKQVTYPLDKTEPYTAACFAAWASPDPIHVEFIPPANVPTFFEAWKELLEGARNLRASQFPDGIFYAEAYMKYGCFGINIRRELTGDEKEVLRRFSIEFERAYTRFLDLQKAEANAREAQIEAALERVRSRTMAMHKSEELKDVIHVVYEQFVHLNMHVEHSGFLIDYKNRDDMHIWLADPNRVPSEVFIPYFDSPHWNSFIEAKTTGKDLFTNLLNFEEKNKFYQGLFNFFPIPPETRQFYLTCPGLAISTVLLDNVGLYIENFSGKPYTEEENAVLMRFGKVFQQTYRRFLDLQRAEAQARESQIEAALERVRAQTMAMHMSTDLANVASVMFEQMRHLGGDLFAFGIVLCDKHQGMVEQWHGMPNSGMMSPFMVPIDLDYIHQYRYDQWKAGVELFSIEIPEHYIARHFELMLALPTVKAEIERMVAGGLELSIPTWEIDYGASFKHGYLLVSALKPFAEDKIFPRFAKVFEQAYTRFLDLQKAEAQAREAQIETALEKVRARSLAMHHSSELGQVAGSLFERLAELGLMFDGALIFLFDKLNRSISLYIATNQLSSPQLISIPFDKDMAENQILKDLWNAIENGEHIKTRTYSGQAKNDYFRYVSSCNASVIPEYIQELQLTTESWTLHLAAEKNSMLGFDSWSGHTTTDEDFKILVRFSKVFEQSYTRFLDLQKAEAQAREAQIEAALERIRSRSMAMHRSEELSDLSLEVVKQVQLLGVPTWFCAFNIYDDDPLGSVEWGSNGQGTFPKYRTPREGVFLKYYEAGHRGETLLINEIKEDECGAHYEYLCSLPGVGDQLLKMKAAGIPFPTYQIDHVAFFKYGYLLFITYEPVPETHEIFKRFAKVFEQSYTRFLDLQRAEAQAKEGQIQLALERVRARTMAMQKSDELLEAGELLCSEMTRLGIHSLTSGYVLFDENENIGWNYTPNPGTGKIMPVPVGTLHTETPEMRMTLECWKNREAYSVIEMDEAQTIRHQTFIASRSINFPISVQELLAISPPRVVLHNFNFREGYILIVGGERLAAEQIEIMLRFTNVFQQTYTRFLDLKKAEAQAREAQIEAALERVRSRSLAMHHTEELQDVVNVAAQQLLKMNIDIDGGMFIAINDEVKDDLPFWAAAGAADYVQKVTLPYFDRPTYTGLREAILRREPFYTEHYSKEEKDEFMRHMFSHHPWNQNSEERKQELLAREGGYTRAVVVNRYTSIGMTNHHGKIFSDADNAVLKRFGAVVEQSYTRFLDLQKAEAQAREAQIETALERVRAKTMAMQRSDELKDAAMLLFQQVITLGVPAFGCGFNIWDEDRKAATAWMAGQDRFQPPFKTSSSEDIFLRIKQASQNGEPLFVEEQAGESLKEHYNYMNSIPIFKEIADKMISAGQALPSFQIMHCAFFSQGYLMFVTFEPVPFAHDIFKRFAKVFDQTYTRFLDLEKAEAQAKEAQIETALEKVRSRTLSMQRSDELSETAAVMFRQLILLGIEPNRLYIIIIKEETGEMEAWLTDEDGSRVSVGFNGNFHSNQSLLKMYKGWKQQRKSLIIDMQGEELQNYFHYLHDELKVPFKGGLEQKRRVQHVAYFSKGMIGIASPEPQPLENVQLLERFAAVFNLTFTRFNDLKIAEAHAEQAEQDLIAIKEAKKKAEEALTELQAAQKQLIQAEKMASLGELTAGIAHEIQNPLNFVNNFAEVNTELNAELQEAIKTGDFGEAAELSQMLFENEQKILLHGKRADAIVKGMLQHTRSGTGTKEPTDINALCDEYLRLAYHGLRAKDKSFNANFRSDFDERIGKVSIVPQEIGRVVLNLISNAFYAVNEKKKQAGDGYEPEVTVTTRLENASEHPSIRPASAARQESGNSLIISVEDNGSGIPENIRNKIFQPFFTTKPTGEGTGLGLSLSYDIVQAHGGEITLESKEGEGTRFEIRLPM